MTRRVHAQFRSPKALERNMQSPLLAACRLAALSPARSAVFLLLGTNRKRAIHLARELPARALRAVRSCNTAGFPGGAAGRWRVYMRIGEAVFGRNLVARQTAASWCALPEKDLVPGPRLRPCSVARNTPSEIHPANTGQREPERQRDCLWLLPGTILRRGESEAVQERDAVSRRSSLPLTCWLDKRLTTERPGRCQRDTLHQYQRSTTSEGQSTSDLYEMKEQDTCRTKFIFSLCWYNSALAYAAHEVPC